MRKSERAIISKEQARAILEKNVANIVRKSALGKTLTRREEDLIARFAAGPSAIEKPAGGEAWVNSYQALGAILGLHRASFPRIMRDHQGEAPRARANGQHSVAAWRNFLEKHPEIKCKSGSTGAGKSDYELEKLRQQCRRLTFENDKAEGLFILKNEVENWAVNLAEKIKEILNRVLKNELPPKLEGLRAPEIAARMEEPILKICTLIRYCEKKEARARTDESLAA